MIDLDAVERQLARDPLCSEANVPDLVAELRAAREIGHALERWSALPGMFWGDTPETGSEIGAALKRWQEVAG